MRATSIGFCCTKFSLATCLVIARHDSPLDVTVWMDISRNPGPTNDLIDICSGGHNLVHAGNLHTSSSSSIRTTSTSNNGPEARFGIPSLITMRPTVTSGYNRPVFCTLTGVPIDRSQCSLFGTNSMKLCNLNTRSIKSKSADFLCYVKSCAADIFAITETWFTERDSAHRAEVTPPGYTLYDRARSGRCGGGTALL